MSALVDDIGAIFRGLYPIFRKLGRYAAYIPLVGDELESFFYDTAELCWDIGYKLYRFARTLEDWQDYVKSAIAKVDIIIAYVLDELSSKVEDVFDAIQDIERDVRRALSKLDDLPSVISDWLEDHRRTLWKLVEDYVEDFVSDFTSSSSDLFQGIRDYVTSEIQNSFAAIAAPVNLVTQWFDDIESFFNDPWAWLWGKLDSFVERYW